ncbi:MAG TPA: hypothetical protein VLS85_02520 [Hanamia sp.]|nr:hypothetical protein [Hanamia sp.]
MRKRVLFIISCVVFMFNSVKAQLTIDSVSFVVQTGAEVIDSGDISSAKGLPGFGKFLLQGIDSQSVNMNGNSIPNLEIDNSNGVWLTGDMRVSNSLLFTNGKFIINNHNFSLADIASVSGMGTGKFIQTDSAGQVFKEISADLTLNEIPVGAGSIYRPAFITTSGSYSGAKVGVQVLDSASAHKPPSTTDYLNTNWTITQTGISGTLNVDARYTDPTDISGTESNLKSYLFDGTDWSSASGTVNTTSNTISFPITIDTANITAMDKFDLLKGKVFLQGAYNSSTGLMSDNLRSAGVIPLSDPYKTSPYSSAFTEVNDVAADTINAAVLGYQASQNDNIVDWVFLELRDAAGTSVLQTRPALVERDGDIVDVDGKSPVTFNNVLSANYTIVVRHRNHLGLSTDPATLTPLLTEKQSTAPLVDFTTSAFLYGGSSAHGVAGDGKYVLWGGDVNMNGSLKYTGPGNDKDYMLSAILGGISTSQISGYSNGDLNMDGVVKYSSPNNDKDFLLSQVLSGIATNSLSQKLP